MAFKSFSSDDFSGGLNTAIAESLLDPKFSPDMYNVDITESKAFKRRDGYITIQQLPLLDAAYTTSATLVTATSDTDMYVQETFVPASYGMVDGDTITGYGFMVAATAEVQGNISTFFLKKTTPTLWFTVDSETVSGTIGPGIHKYTFSSPYSLTATNTYAFRIACGQGYTAGSSSIEIGYGTERLYGTLTATYTGWTPPANTSVFEVYGSDLLTTVEPAGLYRYYQKDGDRYWVVPYHQALYVSAADTNYGYYNVGSRVEAENCYVSGSGSVFSDSLYSGGKGISLSAGESNNFTVSASSSKLDVGLKRYSVTFPDFITASIRVDGGTWVAASFDDTVPLSGARYKQTITFDNLSATTHLVTVKNRTVDPDDFIGSRLGVDFIDWSRRVEFSPSIVSLSASATDYSFATLNDVCYYASKYDNLKKFDGTTHGVVYGNGVSGTLAPKGGFLVEHKRRLFLAGDASDEAILRYSDVDEPEDWDGGGEIYLAGKDSGGRCTGLTVFDNKIFYFSDSRIYSLDTTGPDTNWTAAMAGYNAISWSLGCIAPKTLVQSDNALIFLSADGVRAYGYIPGMFSQDGSGLIDLSIDIRPTIDSISEAMRSQCAGAFYNGRYWLACALDGATYNNSVLVFTLPNGNNPGAWTKYTGMELGRFFVTRGDEYGLYAADARKGKIYRLEYGDNDDGSEITMYYKTPMLSPGGPETMKKFAHLHVAAESGTTQEMTVGVNTDDVECADQTLEITENTAVQPLRAEVSSRGRSIQYEFTSSGAAQPLTVSRLTTTYYPKKVR